jgi:type II secretory pathway pseudopilin PulG
MTFDLKSENGVAMPVMTWMLVVVSLLVTGFFTVSLRLSDTTNEDRSSKRALAAAEAGLQTAVYRLNQLPVAPEQCLADTAQAKIAGSECSPSASYPLGSGASFTYYVTPTFENLPAEDQTCVSLPDQDSMPTDRCITAIGTANGVDRRLQVRVTNLPGPPTFNQVGLLGKSQVFAGNSSKIWSDVGSNTNVHFGNSVETYHVGGHVDVDGSVLRGPGSTYTTEGSSQKIAGGQVFVTAFEFPPIDFPAAEAVADNRTWTSTNKPSGSTYSTSGNTNRHLTITGTSLLPAGTYVFCRVFIRDGAQWRFSGTQPTRVYIDSPDRVGSPCYGQPEPAGTFWAENSNLINQNAGKEHLVDFFIGGTSLNGIRSRPSWCSPEGSPPKDEECRSDFLLDNSGHFSGSVYAPNSTVEANNSVHWWGAIGADKIRFNNSVLFELTRGVKERPSGSQGAALRTAWGECRPAPASSTDPESGC